MNTLRPIGLRGAMAAMVAMFAMVAMASGACGDAKSSMPSTGDKAAGQAEFQSVRDGFGVLATLAGVGKVGNDGTDQNEWSPTFESGPATAAELSEPHNALGDDAGNTFIVDKNAHAVRKVRPDGVIVTVAGTNLAGDDGDAPGPGTALRLNFPNGIWVKGDGTVYILDLGNSKVRRLDSSGQLTTLFGVPGLTLGRGLWVSADESLAYVSSGQTVMRWTPAGGVEAFATGFLALGNLFVEADGTLLVTDRDAHRAYRVGPDRVPVAIAGNGQVAFVEDGAPALETSLSGVRGIWPCGVTGGLFLATHAGSQVHYLDSKGFLHVLIDGGHNAHGGDGEPLTTIGFKVSEVRSVSQNPQGDLLVTENDLGFVRVVRRK